MEFSLKIAHNAKATPKSCVLKIGLPAANQVLKTVILPSVTNSCHSGGEKNYISKGFMKNLIADKVLLVAGLCRS